MHKVLLFLKKRCFLLTILFDIGFILFAYLFGGMTVSTRLEAILFNLHDVSLSDSTFNFVHTELFSINQDDIKGSTVVDYIYSTNATDSSREIMNPYAFLSEGGEKRLFDVKIGTQTITNNCSVSGIHLYSDTKTMQNIALPLVVPGESSYKIKNGRNDAYSGCIIPYSFALDIIDSIDGIETVNDLIEKGVILTIENSHLQEIGRNTLSINNVFYDYDIDEWDAKDKKEYKDHFGTYNEFFSHFNPVTLFVAIYDVYPQEEATFCCDLRDGYGAASIFVDNVVKDSIIKKEYNFNVYFDITKPFEKDLSLYSNDNFFVSTPAAIIFALFCLGSAAGFVWMFYYCCKQSKTTKKPLQLLFICLAIIFASWILIYLISIFGVSAKYFAYLVFNKVGNEIILIGGILIFSISGYLVMGRK